MNLTTGWSHVFTPAKWFTQVSPDRQRFSLCALKSDAGLFSVSWLSSLTETKRLSFFLTPPNSLKCHRSVVSRCWTEQQFKTWQCYFSLAAMYFILCIGSRETIHQAQQLWRCVSCISALQHCFLDIVICFPSLHWVAWNHAFVPECHLWTSVDIPPRSLVA